jgi:hypothetical protein
VRSNSGTSYRAFGAGGNIATLSIASAYHSRSASFTGVSALATASQSNPSPLLVLVAVLPSEEGQLLSHETSFRRRVMVVRLCQIIIFSLPFPIPGKIPWDFSLFFTQEVLS